MEIYPHEAWCPRCSVSHPLGTQRCLHCGHGVMPVRPIESMRSATTTPAPSAYEFPSALDATAEADAPAAPSPRAASPLKIGMNVIWVALFVVVTLVRVCSERG